MQTKGPHLEPARAEQPEVLVEEPLHPPARLVRVVEVLTEEDVSDDVAGGKAQQKGGVEGLACNTGERSGRLPPTHTFQSL